MRPPVSKKPSNAGEKQKRISFKTRKDGLLKKVDELSTLCGVDACAIVYSSLTDPVPHTFPENPLEVQKFLAKVKRMPDFQQTKFSLNADNIVEQKIDKAKVVLTKLSKENKKKETRHAMAQFLSGKNPDLSVDGLNDLLLMINQSLKEVEDRKKELSQGEGSNNNPSSENPNSSIPESILTMPAAPEQQPFNSGNNIMALIGDTMILQPQGAPEQQPFSSGNNNNIMELTGGTILPQGTTDDADAAFSFDPRSVADMNFDDLTSQLDLLDFDLGLDDE